MTVTPPTSSAHVQRGHRDVTGSLTGLRTTKPPKVLSESSQSQHEGRSQTCKGLNIPVASEYHGSAVRSKKAEVVWLKHELLELTSQSIL